MSFDLELTGRRALVTAGTKGIGAAVVEVLHNAGATVVATARAIPTDAQAGVRVRIVHHCSQTVVTFDRPTTRVTRRSDEPGPVERLFHNVSCGLARTRNEVRQIPET